MEDSLENRMFLSILKPHEDQQAGAEERPGTVERRRRAMKCKNCGSFDFWRISVRTGLVAAIMRYRERKPFQCRSCGYIIYRPARRAADNAPFKIPRDRGTEGTEDRRAAAWHPAA
jgi:predicted Zn-ribbon and HTH transcriptional regulator